jgi:hypothetical protein
MSTRRRKMILAIDSYDSPLAALQSDAGLGHTR